MRVVLVGPADRRARLRLALQNTSIEIIGEALSVEDARGRARDVDAFLVAPEDSNDPVPSGEALTPREREVLRLLAEGLPNKTIANRLGISDQTVKFHVASIVGKLGATNRTAAVRLAIRRGLIDI
jgi:DNA-binding CsgD family transcriptional regulator